MNMGVNEDKYQPMNGGVNEDKCQPRSAGVTEDKYQQVNPVMSVQFGHGLWPEVRGLRPCNHHGSDWACVGS